MKVGAEGVAATLGGDATTMGGEEGAGIGAARGVRDAPAATAMGEVAILPSLFSFFAANPFVAVAPGVVRRVETAFMNSLRSGVGTDGERAARRRDVEGVAVAAFAAGSGTGSA
jgi:hypothetical protein